MAALLATLAPFVKEESRGSHPPTCSFAQLLFVVNVLRVVVTLFLIVKHTGRLIFVGQMLRQVLDNTTNVRCPYKEKSTHFFFA